MIQLHLYILKYIFIFIHTYIFIHIIIYLFDVYMYISHYTSIVYTICQLSYGARNVLLPKKNSQLVSCQRTLPGQHPNGFQPRSTELAACWFFGEPSQAQREVRGCFLKQKSSLKLTANLKMGAPWKFGDSYWKPSFLGGFHC